MAELYPTHAKIQRCNKIDTLSSLRKSTRKIHENLHEHPITKPLLSESLTIQQYIKILEAFCGFYVQMESQLQPYKSHYLLASRAEWLKHDLQILEREESDLPLCFELPEINTLLAYLGYCYVVEGSSLGSKLIYSHLQNHLGLSETSGACFFYAHGKQTGKQWKTFTELLEQQNMSGEKTHITIAAAESTFLSLEHWLWQCHRRLS